MAISPFGKIIDIDTKSDRSAGHSTCPTYRPTTRSLSPSE
jgi:hypothetical protein